MVMTPSSRQAQSWALMSLGAVAIGFAGVLYLSQADGEDAATPISRGTDSTSLGQVLDERPSAVPAHIIRRAAPVKTIPGSPNRVIIPDQQINVPVIPIQAASGVLTPPSNPQELGWWAQGAQPGSKTGSALITGHTVHTGGGALDNLNKLPFGAKVIVQTDHGRLTYRVIRVVDFTKGRLSEDAARLFNQDSRGRLVLITCSDWNGVQYLSNTVVTAIPV
jgi:LPXTG-site transpeptidase (sortase) family protein